MSLQFEWDEAKALTNEQKHSVSFIEAMSVFEDEFTLVVFDAQHSFTEERWYIIGLSSFGRILVVVYTERNDVIRIISARKAEKYEEKEYVRYRR